MQTNLKIELDEKHFETDYTKSLSNAFLALRQLQMDLQRESNEELSNELRRVDLMEQDVLHIIELLNFNASNGYKFAKMLQTIRRSRRKIKDRMDERKTAEKLIKTYVNSGFKNLLEGAIVTSEKIQNAVQNRSYRLRELSELEGFNDMIKKQKEALKNQVD